MGEQRGCFISHEWLRVLQRLGTPSRTGCPHRNSVQLCYCRILRRHRFGAREEVLVVPSVAVKVGRSAPAPGLLCSQLCTTWGALFPQGRCWSILTTECFFCAQGGFPIPPRARRFAAVWDAALLRVRWASFLDFPGGCLQRPSLPDGHVEDIL